MTPQTFIIKIMQELTFTLLDISDIEIQISLPSESLHIIHQILIKIIKI